VKCRAAPVVPRTVAVSHPVTLLAYSIFIQQRGLLWDPVISTGAVEIRMGTVACFNRYNRSYREAKGELADLIFVGTRIDGDY
jgi:hypothetical protein